MRSGLVSTGKQLSTELAAILLISQERRRAQLQLQRTARCSILTNTRVIDARPLSHQLCVLLGSRLHI